MFPKKKVRHYPQDDLDKAIEELKGGASSRAVSQKYHIPKRPCWKGCRGR